MDADEQQVKDMLFALRSLGILRDVRGYKRSLVCELDPSAAEAICALMPEQAPTLHIPPRHYVHVASMARNKASDVRL